MAAYPQNYWKLSTVKKICKRVDQTDSATEHNWQWSAEIRTLGNKHRACWGTQVICSQTDRAASTWTPVRLPLNTISVTDQSIVLRRKITIVWIMLLYYIFVRTFLNAPKSLHGIPATPIILRQCSTIKRCWYLHVGTWWVSKCMKFRIGIPRHC